MKDVPTCPIRGCQEPQCEPMTIYVCDDHYPRINGKTLRDWVIGLQEYIEQLEGFRDTLVREATEAHDEITRSYQRGHRDGIQAVLDDLEAKGILP